MKLAEETLGGLWAVEAEDLPNLTNQNMPLITEDEVRRIVNNLIDGKAKGIDGWSPAELSFIEVTHQRTHGLPQQDREISEMAARATPHHCPYS
eukprot:14085848-Heterocapsa_arctica.AAC.1